MTNGQSPRAAFHISAASRHEQFPRFHRPLASLTSEDRQREAVAALEAVLATVQQGRSFLSPWECFHFGRGLKALIAGEYKNVWAAAESALTPFAERMARARAELRAAGPQVQRSAVETEARGSENGAAPALMAPLFADAIVGIDPLGNHRPARLDLSHQWVARGTFHAVPG